MCDVTFSVSPGNKVFLAEAPHHVFVPVTLTCASFGSSVPSCFLVVLFTHDCHMFTILIPYILPLIFPLQLSVYIQTIKLAL